MNSIIGGNSFVNKNCKKILFILEYLLSLLNLERNLLSIYNYNQNL